MVAVRVMQLTDFQYILRGEPVVRLYRDGGFDYLLLNSVIAFVSASFISAYVLRSNRLL